MSEAPADSDRLRDADSLPVVVSVAELVSDIVLIRLACADYVSAAVVASEMVIVTLVAAAAVVNPVQSDQPDTLVPSSS